MRILIRGGSVYDGGALREGDVLIQDGFIEAVGQNLEAAGAEVLSAEGCVVSPGFTDLHVHLREPGFADKETIATGTAAAAAGGFTTVCAMPNLDPVPDSVESLGEQIDLIAGHARVRVYPYAALTVGERGGEMADIEGLAGMVAGFTDDGRGVQSEEMMRACMRRVAALKNNMIAAHCELEDLLPAPGTGTCVQVGCNFAQRHGYTGHSNESEYAEVERDIRLAAETGCHLHICHTSAAQSFQLVRAAKARGERVTCEVTPHNLLLCCDDISEDDGRFKMNPPLRGAQDRDAALAALLDGTADAVATDHAPHTAAEKAGGFGRSLNGVVGLETAFPSLYTHLVQSGKLSLERLLHLFTDGPMAVLGECGPAVRPGFEANLTVLDLQTVRPVDPERFATKGRATPFAGWQLAGWPRYTFESGGLVFAREDAT